MIKINRIQSYVSILRASLTSMPAALSYSTTNEGILTVRFDRTESPSMNTSIYEKTEKGREEITTRKYHLAPKLRTLLVLVDGQKSADKLLQEIAPLGLKAESLQELIDQGYIRGKP